MQPPTSQPAHGGTSQSLVPPYQMRWIARSLRNGRILHVWGFLPQPDPLRNLPGSSNSPASTNSAATCRLLEDANARHYLGNFVVPPWPWRRPTCRPCGSTATRPRLHGVGVYQPIRPAPATVLPKNIAVPLCHACRLLDRPPILSYDGYALYNWKRFDPAGPIALGNIDTIQNFVHLYDEHWFILVHVEIEAIAARILAAIDAATRPLARATRRRSTRRCSRSAGRSGARWRVLRRIPEKMDPALYYKTFRPYIRFFEDVVYEGVDAAPIELPRRDRGPEQHHADAGGVPEDPAPAVAC